MSGPDYEFLNEEAPVEETPEPVAQVETPAEPAPAAPTVAEPREETHVPLAALKAEREKRQQYERELQALKAQQPAPKPPDFYEAPEAYVQQVVQRERQQMTQTFYAALEAQAREIHPDYDEVFSEVQEYAKENPACVPQIMNAANPAMAVYKLGKQVRELKAMQDPDAYRSKIEAEVRAKLEAEYAAKAEAKSKAAAAIPPDLSAARSARDQEVTVDDSLDSILKERKR